MAQKPGPYLIQRGDGYAFRIAVPASLRGHFLSSKGKPLTHITEGLGTDSIKEARVGRDKKRAEWHDKFKRAKDGAALLPAEIEGEARWFYDRSLDEMVDAARRGYEGEGMEWHDGQIVSPEWMALDAEHEQCVEALNNPDFCLPGQAWEGSDVGERYCPVATAIKDVERRRGITIDPTTGTWKALAAALLSARIAAIEGRLRKLDGKTTPRPESFTGASGIDAKTLKPIATAPLRRVIGVEDGLRFSEAAKFYLAEKQHDKGAALRASTVKGRKAHHKLFEDFVYDAPIKDISRDDAANFLAHMQKERGITNKTLNYYVVSISQVFRWARKRGKLTTENPFGDQMYPEGTDTGWEPFTDDELKTLIGSFQQPLSGALPWATVISLYSGLRINEIAQLDNSDIQQKDGVWYFDLKKGDGKLLKSKAAHRKVPIHSRLVEYGLLDLAKKAAKGPLWPELPRGNPDRKPGKRLSQMFGGYREKLGLTRERTAFHSLRKNFGTALDEAGVLPSDREAVLGHSRGFSFDVYSSGPGLKRLQEVIEKVEYPKLRIH